VTPEREEGTDPVEQLAQDLPAERAILSKAIGGWRGMFDSGVPAAVFLIAYTVNGSELAPAIWSAVIVGAVIAVWRLVRKQPLLQIAGGFAGIGVSAAVAAFTGKAEDFFLPGLLVNLGYGTAALVSILIGWPVVGLMVGAMVGEPTGWRSDARLRRTYATATWVWVGLFYLRLAVQLPFYLAGAVGVLGTLKIVMGWPLFLLAAWFSYLIVRPAMAEARERGAEARDTAVERAATAADQSVDPDSRPSSDSS